MHWNAMTRGLRNCRTWMNTAKKFKNCAALSVLRHIQLPSLIVETGDFSRFVKGNYYGSFVGLVPGEDSKRPSHKQMPYQKAGNKHLRTLLTECA